jgi:hypothetical protein
MRWPESLNFGYPSTQMPRYVRDLTAANLIMCDGDVVWLP